jgi:GNAT superfamily N-acetyltransferase
MPMLNIRPYTQDDLPTLRSLVAELHDSVRRFDPSLPPSTQIIDAYFEHLLQACEDLSGTFFLAERGARTEGYACVFGLVPAPEPDESGSPYSFLSDLYVRPEYRGSGVGRRLVEHVEHYAAGLGASRVVIKLFAGSQSALRFWDGLGYRRRVLELSKTLS